MYSVAQILIVLIKARFHSVEFIRNYEDHHQGFYNEEKKIQDFMKKTKSLEL